MKTDPKYEYVRIDDTPYEPRFIEPPGSAIPAVAMVINRSIHKACMPCEHRIKKMESTLSDFNNMRYKLALFFYKVAECAMRTRGIGELKGITINCPKEDFCTEEFKALQSGIVNLHDDLKEIMRKTSIIASIIRVVTVVVILACIYPAIRSETNTIIVIVVDLLLVTILTVVTFVVIKINHDKKLVLNRLENAINEKCADYFDDMYNRLELVRQDGDRYLYNIKKGHADVDEMVYHLAGHICKANERRSFVHKKLSLSSHLLNSSVI